MVPSGSCPDSVGWAVGRWLFKVRWTSRTPSQRLSMKAGTGRSGIGNSGASLPNPIQVSVSVTMVLSVIGAGLAAAINAGWSWTGPVSDDTVAAVLATAGNEPTPASTTVSRLPFVVSGSACCRRARRVC